MIKVGIIGSGFGLYCLLPAFRSTPKCKVTCIYGEKTERLNNYCKSIGLVNIYSDWQEMLNQEDLDAIAIAVPPFLQYKIAKAGIKKGLHIFAEKPLAINYKQAQELYLIAKEKGIINGVDFEFTEINEWKKVKKIIDNNTFGSLKHLSLNWDFQSYDIQNNIKSWKTDSTLGGGALSFYFSHVLFYLEYFAGKIINIKSKLYYSEKSLNGGEVGINALFSFENKVSGFAHFYCNAPGINKHQLTFIFEKGTVILENRNGSYTDFTISSNPTGNKKNITSVNKIQNEGEDERIQIVKQLTGRFIRSIINKKQFYPSFKEGLRVEKLIEMIKSNENVQ